MGLLHLLRTVETPHELLDYLLVLLLLPPELVVHRQHLLAVLSLQVQYPGLVVPCELGDEVVLGAPLGL